MDARFRALTRIHSLHRESRSCCGNVNARFRALTRKFILPIIICSYSGNVDARFRALTLVIIINKSQCFYGGNVDARFRALTHKIFIWYDISINVWQCGRSLQSMSVWFFMIKVRCWEQSLKTSHGLSGSLTRRVEINLAPKKPWIPNMRSGVSSDIKWQCRKVLPFLSTYENNAIA